MRFAEFMNAHRERTVVDDIALMLLAMISTQGKYAGQTPEQIWDEATRRAALVKAQEGAD